VIVSMRFSKSAPAKLASAALVALWLGGCAGRIDPVRTGTVYAATVSMMSKRDMERSAPILFRVYKESSELEVWKEDRSGRFRLLRTYHICKFSGTLGPKKEEGDHQAPEGFYSIREEQLNPHSREYLAFNIGYPNAFDRSLGRTGDSLMVHGGCRSVGCYAMTDAQIEEIYGLAYEAFQGGQDSIQFQAYPFRMTDANMERHAADPNIPFWKALKRGSDLFEKAERPPKVAVCDREYVFLGYGASHLPEGGSCSAES
jgi:murein L,D-transpeptidase YafK